MHVYIYSRLASLIAHKIFFSPKSQAHILLMYMTNYFYLHYLPVHSAYFLFTHCIYHPQTGRHCHYTRTAVSFALHGNNLRHHLDRNVINQVNHLTALVLAIVNVVVEHLVIHSDDIAPVAHITLAFAAPLYCRQSKYLLWH